MPLRKYIFALLLLIILTSCSPIPPVESEAGNPTPVRSVQTYANNVVMEAQFEFEADEDLESWALEKGSLEDGEVRLVGDQTWGSYLVYLNEKMPGSGATARFKYSLEAVFSIVMQHGEWNTPGFREIGFGLLENRFQSVLAIGDSFNKLGVSQRPILIEPDTWYQAGFFIDREGAVVIALWPESDPESAALFSWQLAVEDRDLGWRPAVQVQSGTVAVDSAAFFSFDSFQAAALPALAAQQPVTTPAPTSTPAPTPTPGPTPIPTLGAGSVVVNQADQAQLAYIPAGEFEMGFDEDLALEFHDQVLDPVDLTQYPHVYVQYLPHVVYTEAFWMYKFEVTNQQFAAFLNEMGNQKIAPYNSPNRGSFWYVGNEINPPGTGANDGIWLVAEGLDDHPVVGVDWYGARAYCEWVGGRLPTEAEWEKAARGGLDGKMFPWGDQAPLNDPDGQGENRASFDDKTNGSAPVGSYAANGFGLFDMTGNVFEWTADWFANDAYFKSVVENPQGPAYFERDLAFDLFDRRVIRGGSWYHNQYYLTAWYRGGDYPFSHNEWLGFRCLVDIEQEE